VNPTKICFVCDEYPPGPHGGIGTFVQMIARALVGEGHEVKVIGVYPHAYPAPDHEVDQGVQVLRLRCPVWRLGWVWGRYRVFRQVASWAHSREIELVEVVDYAGPAAMWPKLPIPVVARLHGSASYFARELNTKVKPTLFWLERSSLRRADFSCSVSHYAAKKTSELFDLPKCPDAVLYNFIDSIGSDQSSQRSERNVVFSGTLTYKKGIVPLIKAWRSVLAKRDDAVLHVYGKDGLTYDGQSMKSMLQSELPEADRKSVRFHGHTDRTELISALSKARLGVFPSYAESFGLAPAESMATGCPTIYSQRGCGGELLRDGQDGLLVDPDQPDAIAEAIVRLMEDDQLAGQLGAAGQQRIRDEFSVEALMPRNISFYRQCIERKKVGPN